MSRIRKLKKIKKMRVRTPWVIWKAKQVINGIKKKVTKAWNGVKKKITKATSSVKDKFKDTGNGKNKPFKNLKPMSKRKTTKK